MGESDFCRIPAPVVSQIVSFFNIADLARAACTCKLLAQEARSEDHWVNLWRGPLPWRIAHAGREAHRFQWQLLRGDIKQEQIVLKHADDANAGGFPVHVSVVRVWETFLITAAGQDVTVWNIDEEKIVYRRTSTYNITSLFPCHGMFAVGDMTGGLRSYSLDTGEDIFHVEGGANGGGWSSVMTICATDILRSNWANSKSVLFVGTDDGLIRSFDLFTGAFLRFFCGHRRSVSCVDTTTQIWGTSEPALISGSADGTIRIWKSSSAECVHTIVINSLESGIRPRVHSIFVHGRSICCGTDHSVTIWEILPKLKVGRRSAVAGEDQVDQVLVSCESKQINEFALHQRPIRWLQVVGRVVVTCSGDYVLRFWDQDSGDCIRNVHATSGAAFLSFHLTGKLYTSCLFDTSVQVTEFLPINSKRSSSAILG